MSTGSVSIRVAIARSYRSCVRRTRWVTGLLDVDAELHDLAVLMPADDRAPWLLDQAEMRLDYLRP